MQIAEVISLSQRLELERSETIGALLIVILNTQRVASYVVSFQFFNGVTTKKKIKPKPIFGFFKKCSFMV